MDPAAILERFLDRPTGRRAAGRARRLRPGAGRTAGQRPGVRRAVRRVPGRPRDARGGRLARRRPDRPGAAGTGDRGAPAAARRTSSTRRSWPCRTVPRSPRSWSARRAGVDGQPVLRDARHRLRADLHGSPGADVLRRTARGFISVAGLVGVIVALIVGGSLAAAAEAFLPNSSSALAGLASRPRRRSRS